MSCKNVQQSWNSAGTVLDKPNVYTVYNQVCQDKGIATQDVVYDVTSIVKHRKQVAALGLVCTQMAQCGATERLVSELLLCWMILCTTFCRCGWGKVGSLRQSCPVRAPNNSDRMA